MKSRPKTKVKIEDMLLPSVETLFQKLFRLIFYSQESNVQFNKYLIKKIIILLYRRRKKFVDGLNKEADASNKNTPSNDAFIFEKVIGDLDICTLRIDNLTRFIQED